MEFNKKSPRIYIISGKAKTGKNEIADIINKIYSLAGLKCINIAFASYLKEYTKNIIGWDGNENTKPREFLQSLGIELIKNKINPHLLIDRIVDDIKVYSYFFDIITISDARLLEEIKSIKATFAKVVTINISSNMESRLTKKQQAHITEIELDDYQDFDYQIYNNGNYNDLFSSIDKIIKEIENNE